MGGAAVVMTAVFYVAVRFQKAGDSQNSLSDCLYFYTYGKDL